MKEITLYRHERMLFALLRASLHERKTEITLFLDSTDEEWKQCHRLAVSQGTTSHRSHRSVRSRYRYRAKTI